VLYKGHLGRCKKLVNRWDREMYNTCHSRRSLRVAGKSVGLLRKLKFPQQKASPNYFFTIIDHYPSGSVIPLTRCYIPRVKRCLNETLHEALLSVISSTIALRDALATNKISALTTTRRLYEPMYQCHLLVSPSRTVKLSSVCYCTALEFQLLRHFK